MDPFFRAAVYEPLALLLGVHYTDDGIVVTDPQGRITWMNEGFYKLCGYSLPEVVGRKPGEVLQGPLTDLTTVNYIRLALLQRQACRAELVNYHKDGHTYWVSLRITPIIDSDGELLRFIAIERDFTPHKQLEQRLQRTIAEQQAIIQRWEQRELLPICASCKRIRTEQGTWQRIELYISEQTHFDFTHTFCPDCIARLYPEEEA